MKNTDILSPRELNREFSRAVQACMVDGYDLDGERNDYSNMTSHAVMVKSQRGKRDTFRTVVLEQLNRSPSWKDRFEPAFRFLTVTEYANARDMERKENGKELSRVTFYTVKDGGVMSQCAWTRNKEIADRAVKLHFTRCAQRRGELRGHELDLTNDKTRELLLSLVRRRGERCKCVNAKNIVKATIGLNLDNKAPIRVEVHLDRGGNKRFVQAAARKPIDYSRTTPHNLAVCAREWGEKGKDRDYVIGKLTHQIW